MKSEKWEWQCGWGFHNFHRSGQAENLLMVEREIAAALDGFGRHDDGCECAGCYARVRFGGGEWKDFYELRMDAAISETPSKSVFEVRGYGEPSLQPNPELLEADARAFAAM